MTSCTHCRYVFLFPLTFKLYLKSVEKKKKVKITTSLKRVTAASEKKLNKMGAMKNKHQTVDGGIQPSHTYMISSASTKASVVFVICSLLYQDFLSSLLST